MQLLKNEPLKVTYSYWDGTGHRRQTVVRKGDTIGAFLAKVRDQLSADFRDLRCGLEAVSRYFCCPLVGSVRFLVFALCMKALPPVEMVRF